ncbi:MAG: ABC transporter ATP-binding protein [Phycisphaerae bacterium]|nr:ABC transporter ATP-binding protein [Phycisphaerae bacterium]
MVAEQTQSDAVVRTIGLTKVFRDFWLREKVTAVEDLDLEIAREEVFGLLGPNGSGKTTTLKMILSLLLPTRGRIHVFDRPPTDVKIKAKIGFLPEDTYLYPFLDSRETLDYYGRLFHLPRGQRRRRIEMLLEMVGLGPMAYRRVAEYSKGMRRRLGLAQALINDPDLLILDEPTSGMDPIAARQFKDLILTLARRGKTVLLSSHLLADVEDVCDRVCVLYGGQRRALGRVEELLTRQGSTQIVTEQLDEPTLERIYALLDAAGRDVLEVTRPRDKLEALFMRIVDEARREKVAAGAAVSTGEVAEFLRQGDGGDVIEQLVRGGEGEPERTGATEEAATPDERDQTVEPLRERVLEELVVTDEASPEEAPLRDQPPVSSDASRPAARDAQADRGVIDGLIQNAERREGETSSDGDDTVDPDEDQAHGREEP